MGVISRENGGNQEKSKKLNGYHVWPSHLTPVTVGGAFHSLFCTGPHRKLAGELWRLHPFANTIAVCRLIILIIIDNAASSRSCEIRLFMGNRPQNIFRPSWAIPIISIPWPQTNHSHWNVRSDQHVKLREAQGRCLLISSLFLAINETPGETIFSCGLY